MVNDECGFPRPCLYSKPFVLMQDMACKRKSEGIKPGRLLEVKRKIPSWFNIVSLLKNKF
jgi:hypothetical protein